VACLNQRRSKMSNAKMKESGDAEGKLPSSLDVWEIVRQKDGKEKLSSE